jgi:hypothetical protein
LLVAPGAYPRRKHLKGAPFPFGLALALPSNSKTLLERFSKDKPSSLLGLIVSDEFKKSFNNVDDWSSCSRDSLEEFLKSENGNCLKKKKLEVRKTFLFIQNFRGHVLRSLQTKRLNKV